MFCLNLLIMVNSYLNYGLFLLIHETIIYLSVHNLLKTDCWILFPVSCFHPFDVYVCLYILYLV